MIGSKLKDGCVIISILTITCFLEICAQSVYHVKPTFNTPCPYDTCHTLTDYVGEVGDQYFTSNTSRIVLLFLSGEHIADGGVITLSNANVLFQGNSTSFPDITSRIVCTKPTSFRFINIEKVELKFLTFISCGITQLGPEPANIFKFCSYAYYGQDCRSMKCMGAICVSSVVHFKLIHCSITNSYLALSVCNSQVTFRDNKLTNNTAKFGSGISAFKSNLSLAGKNVFAFNKAYICGGGIYAENCSLMINGSVLFAKNRALDGGGIYVKFSNLTIDGNGIFMRNVAGDGGGMFARSSNVSLYGSTTFLQNSALNDGGGVSLIGSHFPTNSKYGPTLTLHTNSKFIHNIARSGGGISVYPGILQIDGNIQFIDNVGEINGGGISIVEGIANVRGQSSFQNNTGYRGGGMSAQSATVRFEGNHSFSGNTATEKGGGIWVYTSTVVSEETSILTLTHNIAYAYGGGVCVEYPPSELVLKGSNTYTKNSGVFGGALFAKTSSLKLNGNNTFVQNVADYGGAIFLEDSPQCTLSGKSTFLDNSVNGYGGAIHSFRSILSFGGTQLFTNNTAAYGGAMALTGRDKTELHLLPNTVTEFVRNYAKHRGGALIVEDNPFTSCNSGNTTKHFKEVCFLRTNPGFCLKPHNITTCKFAVSLCFDDNFAEEAGNILYGGNVGMCRVEIYFPNIIRYSLSGASVFKEYGKFFGRPSTTSEVSSDPFHVCACSDGQLETNCSQSRYNYGVFIYPGLALQTPLNFSTPTHFDIPPPWPNTDSDNSSGPFQVCNYSSCAYSELVYDIFPGETVEVQIAVVGQLFGTVPGVVYTKFDTAGGTVKLGHLQSTQFVNKTCTPVYYTVFSKDLRKANEVLLHVFAEGPCSDLGHPLSISVKLHPCPVAFTLSVEGRCVCERRLRKYTDSCDIDSASIQGDGEFWVGLVNDKGNYSSRLILHPHCPFDYCRAQPTRFTIDNRDLQCASKRSGILCGACQSGYSLALGSSQCLECSNKYLSLIIVFILAGFILVITLFTCKITVSAGTISGLTFYANILAVNRAVFFPPKETNILTVFIAWLNLDLGIETCFTEGMDAYTKIWLQFVFPIYIWFLVGLITCISYYSTRIARIIGPTNPVAVLATLFLLSYTKLLRTIITAFSFTTLDYPNDESMLVWVHDANIGYLKGKHIALFLAALLVSSLLCLPYTVLLVFGQWIQTKSNLRLLSWVKRPQVRALFDAYYAPYKNRHRYWVGLLLLLRFIIFIMLAVIDINSPRDPSVNLFIIIAMSVGLQTWVWNAGGMYKKWYLNTLESSFILNLALLAAATHHIRLAGGNQAAVVYSSVGVAFTTFIVIITYHICQRVRESRVWRRSILPQLKQLRLRVKKTQQEEPAALKMEGNVPQSPAANRVVPTTFIELREPLLDSTV